MNDPTPPGQPHPEGDNSSGGDDASPQIRARVPDHVSEGVFSNAVIVMTGPSEFVLDFLQTIGRPQRIAARVVLPHPVMPQFIEALKKNIEIYSNRFGAPQVPQAPKQQDGGEQRRPTPQEIYDDLKMPDTLLSGSYANGVMIGHAATEFSLDFLTSFFPQSAVSSRVYIASGQIPRLLESLQGAWQGLQGRAQQNPPPGTSPDDGPSWGDSDPDGGSIDGPDPDEV
jgi:hypothetical protein